MPGVSHALTFSSGECKNMKSTPGKSMLNNPINSQKQQCKIQKQNVKQSPTSSDIVEQAKVCKPRPLTLPSSFNQNGLDLEHNHTVSKHKPLNVCTSCSSNDVIEVNIKLKSCQNCQNVIIDELNYDNQPIDGVDVNKDKNKVCISPHASTSNGAGLNFYHQQLMVVTKKLKNLYKNRIHSSCSDNHSVQAEQNYLPDSVPATPITATMEESVSLQFTSTSESTSKTNRKPIKIITPQNPPIKLPVSVRNNHCCSNNLPTDEREYATSKTSSISNQPFKSNVSNNSTVVHKDALILRICDLDDNVKCTDNDNSMHAHIASPVNLPNLGATNLSVKGPKPADKRNDGYTNKKSSPVSTQTPGNRKIVIISDEYKKKSEKRDIHIRDRKELIKQFHQNKSKSLDLLPPSKSTVKKSARGITHEQICASQSVMNIPNESSADENCAKIYENSDDGDGPYESINSVELIFISDEFLNKAVKHDLKILKSKQTATESDSMRSSLSKKKKIRKLECTVSPVKMLRPDNANTEKQKSPSPVSPDSHQSSGARSGSHRSSLTSSKKLIVISEDFKRKSLENNVVIVDNNANDSDTIGEVVDKRKSFQQTRKLSRQQSSIDDVANKMVSHAFRSFEEPDEQCLESKEIKTPE